MVSFARSLSPALQVQTPCWCVPPPRRPRDRIESPRPPALHAIHPSLLHHAVPAKQFGGLRFVPLSSIDHVLAWIQPVVLDCFRFCRALHLPAPSLHRQINFCLPLGVNNDTPVTATELSPFRESFPAPTLCASEQDESRDRCGKQDRTELGVGAFLPARVAN
jgi:hypothetical protein